LVGLTINLVIGAGIFGLPSRLFAIAGVWSVFAVAACALIVAIVVRRFAAVGSRSDRTGGPYLYVRETFGELAGFQMGWLMWIRSLTSFGAICNLLVTYLGVFWPAAATGTGRVWVSSVVAIGLAILVLRGVRTSATLCNALTIGKLLPLAGFVCIGLFFIRPERLELGPWPGASTFSSALLPLVFAFAGFDTTVIASGEMRQPRRDLAFGLFVSMAVIALAYTLIQLVCVGTHPDLAGSERPLAEAAAGFMGATGARVIAIGAVVSTLGALFATVMISPRVLFALAENRQLPHWLAATHPRFHTPYVALAASVACMLAVTLSGSFAYAVTINAMIRLVTYAVTALALIVLRRRAKAPPAGFSVAGGPFVASAAILLCMWVISRSTGREARDLAIAAGVGLLVYAVGRFVARHKRELEPRSLP